MPTLLFQTLFLLSYAPTSSFRTKCLSPIHHADMAPAKPAHGWFSYQGGTSPVMEGSPVDRRAIDQYIFPK
ncbi:hypothetical protein BD779DRAFT_595078 [Infundibulicybe gibba]|nr:hypothetical protein BD779DRAFT_595078 [Infundibulicybe gibba]